MPQIESKKRLIRKGKIVGYERRRRIKNNVMIIEQSVNRENWFEVAPYMVDTHQDWIKHDSVEQGIKVNEEWHFPSDKFKCKYDSTAYVLRWSDEYYAYTFSSEDEQTRETSIVGIELEKVEWIGNIHDEK